ncbi:hypothetical protein SDRG_14692 [Saprolegnia diclina VS20]|uniref:Conserved oligomeric Golgi complex subunit 7 n=1 Tax=Saprolegnia diclina (strain VS20) TaxID=1156394 RepID=T0PPX1_SAPDV|nr:hypothetical protein SDRG_14692 [Saprolegnia diclina VS20]EQC27489.1 hypothetical protein SDRG_14692 [Saprolegnia diclina VS20]|eukprot:XP_008619063.1 hypothetical protein SDRG_14692 [Saprolegnia diclina VS20]
MNSAVLTVADLGDDVGDIYAWIDAQVSVAPGDPKTHLEGLLPQFHVLSQELSANLQQCLETFPSFVNHVQLLQLKTQTLGQSLHTHSPSTQSARGDATPAYNTLSQLHTAKMHMQQCSNALQESAAWKQHSRYVVQVTADPTLDLAKLATHLAAMHKSLETLQRMPGHDERAATMDTVSRDVETALVPQLHTLLQEPTLPLSPLQDCLAIFAHLNRASLVEDAYAKRRPAPMHRLWHASTPADADGLAAFYAEVESFLERETRYCQQLFAAPLPVVLELVHATLSPLASAVASLLDAAPAQLLPAFKAATRFAHRVLLHTVVSWTTPTAADVHKVLHSVFGPFEASFTMYERIETSVVTESLLALLPSTSTLLAPAVDELSARVWLLVEARVQHAMELMAGAVLPEALEALTTGLSALAQMWSSKMAPAPAPGATVDWSHLHEALAMLKACGGVLVAQRACQARLRLRVLPTLALWFPDATPPSLPPRIQLSPTSKAAVGPDAALHVTVDDCINAETLPVAVVKLWLQRDKARYQSLQLCKESVATDDDVDVILGPVFRDWTLHVQQRTYATVLTPVASVLTSVPTMECWIQADESADLPSFSMLPQEYMTSVADLLLSLLPQLEPFAESSGLSQALAASHNIVELSHEAWAAVARVLGVPQDEAFLQLGELPAPDADAGPAAAFVDQWTFVVASGAMAAVLSVLLAIPQLSASGKAQVVCDVSYLQNVLHALGVPTHPLLLYYKDRLCGDAGSEHLLPPSMTEKIDLWIDQHAAADV